MAYLPPATTFAPREDWDDGDFDLPSDRPFHAPSRQTSFASSSTRHTPLQNSSRPSFSDDPFEEDDMAGFDDIEDLDDGQGTIKLKLGHVPPVPLPRASTKASTGGKAGFISLDSMKAMQASAQLSKPNYIGGNSDRSGDAFEDEDDYGDAFEDKTSTLKMPVNAPGLPLRLVRPGVQKETQWDEFDAMMDEDERESTLKAGSATLKGLRERFGPGQPLADKGNQQRPGERKQAKPMDDGDLEDSFSIPLTLEHLKLANKKDYPSVGLRHRSSRSSLITNSSRSDWDRDIGDPHRSASAFASPSTSSTSITSASMPVTDQSETDIHARSIMVADEVDDFENDFVLPTASFFSSGQSRELNNLLDRKRKAQPAVMSQTSAGHPGKNQTVLDSGTFKASRLTRATISSAAKSRYDAHEEAFEDGLVLEEEGAELNQGRLSRLRKARLPPATPSKGAAGTLRKDSGGSRGRYDSGDLFRERKISGKADSPENKLRKTDSGRVMVDAVTSSSAIAGPSTPHRLRPQKSHSRLADRATTTPGPTIAKKQSLASLRDAMASQQTEQPSYVAPTASSVARQAAKSRERFSEAANQPMPPMPLMQRIPSDHHRQTVPVSASKSKSRPALESAFNRPSSSASNPSHSTHSAIATASGNHNMTIAHVLRKPKSTRTYGDGTELDVFDDLVVDRSKETFTPSTRSTASHASSAYISGLPNNANASSGLGLGRPSHHDSGSLRMKLSNPSGSTSEKRKKPHTSILPSAAATSVATPVRKERKKAGLIRHLGKLEKKQVGEMTWNPQTLRWEGNYGVLREFDNQLASSVRPALIAYRAPNASNKPGSADKDHQRDTGRDKNNDKGDRSISNSTSNFSANPMSSAVRVVGNMMFDPERMCWTSTLPQEEEEADPFEGLADDEDDDTFFQDRRGGGGNGTITKGAFAGLDLREPTSGRSGSTAYGRRFISDVSTAYTATTTPNSNLSRSQYSDNSDDLVDQGGRVDLRQGRNLLSGKQSASALRANYDHGDRSISLASSRILNHNIATDYDLTGWTWVDEDLYRETRQAERRHTQEMLKWYGASENERMRGKDVDKELDRARRREEKRLWEIRHLVMDG